MEVGMIKNPDNIVGQYPKISLRAALLWGIALFALRLWAFRFLGKIFAYGWPEVTPLGISGVSGYVKIGVGLFVMIFLTCTHTWSMLSEKKLHRFVWVFPLCDLLPAVLGILWGYLTFR